MTAARSQVQTDAQQSRATAADEKQDPSDQTTAEEELQRGTALTRQGLFRDAIPHLLAAREKTANPYAANFNLAICYVGTGVYKKAIQTLNELQRTGHDAANVQNLLAQAYIGNGQDKEALAALQSAASMTPQDEKLYLFVADACMEHGDFSLGLKVIDIGLGNLPDSALLHYQRGMFLSQMDQFDRAKADFALASQLAHGNEVGYMSAAHEALLEGDIPQAIRVARDGVGKGFQDPILLTILGQALVRSGVTPGQPEFSEAQAALEKSVAERPNDPASQIALGQIDLMAGRLDDAIAHLEKARTMRPNQPSLYVALAKAYQRHGETQRAQEALATLEKLNEAQEERIRNAPGETKLSYGGGERKETADGPPK
jgi:tetratricopeptide (TPR) repeat protein